jgi:hypothetical protein
MLIRHLSYTHFVVDITFYVEELAMECAQSLLEAGITAVHRLDQPRVVSLQLPSLLAQHKSEEALKVLETFLDARAPGGFRTQPPSTPASSRGDSSGNEDHHG